MKTKIMIVLAMAVGLSACNQEVEKQQEVNLDSEAKKLSYAIGMDVGKYLEGLGANIDYDVFIAAILDVATNSEAQLSMEEAMKLKQDFSRKKQEELMEKKRGEAAENKAKGEAFLEDNAKKEGVIVTASGLQYEVIKQGDGDKPKPENTVKVHYKGTTIDGEEFDSSYSRGQPISFPLNGVIKGWTEGVALMPVGSKYRFFIPAELAYGERGAGAKIGPNSTLIFEVELLSIEK